MAKAITISGSTSADGTGTIYTVPAGKRFIGNYDVEAKSTTSGKFHIISIGGRTICQGAPSSTVRVSSAGMIVLKAGTTITHTKLGASGGSTAEWLISGIEEDDV